MRQKKKKKKKKKKRTAKMWTETSPSWSRASGFVGFRTDAADHKRTRKIYSLSVVQFQIHLNFIFPENALVLAYRFLKMHSHYDFKM